MKTFDLGCKKKVLSLCHAIDATSSRSQGHNRRAHTNGREGEVIRACPHSAKIMSSGSKSKKGEKIRMRGYAFIVVVKKF